MIERFAAQLGVGEWAFAQLGCASGVAAEPESEHRRSTHGLRSSRAGHELYLLESGELTRAHRIPVLGGGQLDTNLVGRETSSQMSNICQ